MSRQRRRRAPHAHGVIIVDKPLNMTSHDVVARVRRHFDQRRVGHAGTLDPAASGVLVVMLGEATKLGPYLTAHDKSYQARVQLGRATDTLDAEGTVTAEAPLPAWLAHPDLAAERVEAALAAERARHQQIPPVFSAIKIDGRAAHRLARAGEPPELSARAVRVSTLALSAPPYPDGSLELTLHVSKGYYVRSLARDLGEQLGLPAHLSALRRSASGPFSLADATPLDGELSRALMSTADAACRALPSAQLNDAGVSYAQQGKALDAAHFAIAPGAGLSAWLDANGNLIALGEALEGAFRVKRGFPSPASPELTT